MDKRKIWCSLGDSITYQETRQSIVSDQLGFEHINCGLGSTTVSNVLNSEITRPSFYTDERLGIGDYSNTTSRIIESEINYHLVLPNRPDIVTVFGGLNDMIYGNSLGKYCELKKQIYAKDLTTFIGAYSYLIEKLLLFRPSIRIFLIAPHWVLFKKHQAFQIEECVDAIQLIAEYYALPFINLYNKSGINRITSKIYLHADQIHPNEWGGKMIAEQVIKEMKNIL